MAQGGDWGAVVTDVMGAQEPAGLIGIHVNMPGAIPPEVDAAALAGAPPPAGLSADERESYDMLTFFYKHVYYAFFMGTRPQTLTAFCRTAGFTVRTGRRRRCPWRPSRRTRST